MTQFLFDAGLCVLILGVALASVIVREAFAAVAFFIVYGLLIAIAWTRLDAVDVALAEAAIGAGLTGALFLGAMSRIAQAAGARAAPRRRPERLALVGALLLCGGAGVALMFTVLRLPDVAGSLTSLVEANLALTGVTNKITAVLINFRGYDTLLESVVLLVALIGVWSATPDRFWGGPPGVQSAMTQDNVLSFFGAILPPVGFVVGAYLIWIGSSAPGGAFQGGTVWAAMLLLAVMAALIEPPPVTSRPLRFGLVSGPALFLAIGIVGTLRGSFLGLDPPFAKALTLAIEVGLAVSIAATLALIVIGNPRRAA